MVIAALLSGCASVVYERVSEPAGEVLSVHQTVARFEGFEEVPCRHLTAQCPNACTHGGKYARFAIVEYTGYEKPGQLGDEKQAVFACRVALRDGSPDPLVPAALRAALEELKVGQVVGLDWKHVYVTSPEGSKWPERVVTRLAE